MSGSDDEDKQHEPTQKKLDDARKKGEVVRSVDLNTTAAYGGFLLAGVSIGAVSLMSLGEAMQAVLQNSNDLAEEVFRGHIHTGIGRILNEIIWAVTPWMAVPAVLVILSVVAQQSFVVAPDKLIPKLNRISPISNAKNKFGRNGLFEFGKSFAKLMIFSVAVGYFLFNRTTEIIGTIALAPGSVVVLLGRYCLEFLFLVLVVSAAIGALDFIWQSAEHTRKNRMSHKEVADEHKQNEGDPHLKQQRRQKGYEIAMNQMLADIPTTDVIIVNPTHFAVALKWDRQKISAPVCVAKGVDEVAAKIREIASENGVPIHRDAPTARALHKVVEIGQEVLPEHYQAVAAAIRFAEAMRAKAKGVL